MTSATIGRVFIALALCAGCGSDGETDSAMGDADGDSAGTESAGSGPGSGPGSDASADGSSGDEDSADGTESADGGTDTDDDPDPGDDEDPFDELPEGEDQWEHVCAQNWGDPVSTAFCAGDSPPTVTSLLQLQTLLGLEFGQTSLEQGQGGNPNWAYIGHSTSIAARAVTPLNPRAFVFTPPTGSPQSEFTALAFVRSESFVEIISKDPTAGGALRFFLFKFEHQCEAGGCSYGDMYTLAWESGWDEYTLYDGDTIRNTIFDCKQCHQPSGPGTPQILLMRELAADWGHWFYPETIMSADFLDAYRAAKGIDEPYGEIPALAQWNPQYGNQSQSRPGRVQSLVQDNGFANQPMLFDTQTIEGETQASGSSATWQALYAAAVAGQTPPIPHYGSQITDPAKLATATTAYQNYLSGVISKDELPDIGDIWDEAAYPDISVRPKAGLSGREILVHMCQHCHNSSLDQNISRARFNVEELDSLSDEQKSEAVLRLMLPDSSARKMPPPRFHELSTEERDLAIAELEN